MDNPKALGCKIDDYRRCRACADALRNDANASVSCPRGCALGGPEACAERMWQEMTVDDRLIYIRELVHTMVARLKDTTALDSSMLKELMDMNSGEKRESMSRRFFPSLFSEGAVPLGTVRRSSRGRDIPAREG